jgi:hypothetical protein
MLYYVRSLYIELTIDLQEAVRLSKPGGGVAGLEALEISGHWTALDELSQKMLQKVFSLVFN